MRIIKEFSSFRQFENKNMNCWEDKENPFKWTESYLDGEFHQSILDIGYCWWQKGVVSNYAEMIEKMRDDFGKEFAILILLGKYNQQVGNGGHQQYFDNGYASYESGGFGSHDEIGMHEEMTDWFRELKLDETELGKKVYKIITTSGDFFEKMAEGEQYCEECRGQGYEEETCYNCNGDGNFVEDCYECGGSGEVDDEECPECGGSGEIEEQCQDCEGEGVITNDCTYCEGNGTYNMSDQFGSELNELDDKYYDFMSDWEEELEKYAEKVIHDKFPKDVKDEDYEAFLATRKYNL